jgi:hypothetical protein
MRLLFGVGFAAILIAVASASAENAGSQDAVQAAGAPAAAPPGRVGQIDTVSGKVGFRAPGDAVWSDAEVNDPVASGVSLRTNPLARAVIRFGPDTVVLADSTEITIINLNDRLAEIAVSRGRIGLDTPRPGKNESVQIDLPRGGVWLQPGRYDINVGGSDQPPWVAAFTGSARFVGGGADIRIGAARRVLLGGSITTEAADEDEFSVWCAARAIDEARLAAPYFVSPAMTGFAALDDAGSWQTDGKYGEVWVPDGLPADWAPYRYGHWRWVAPWGWSWIDDQPWGFAPSHYGRWVLLQRRWSWIPGAYTAHPVYAPAVVAFLGTPGVGLSYAAASGAAVAWFPLAPSEVYWPSGSTDLDYIRKLNAANIPDLGSIRFRANGEPPADIVNGPFANREFASVVPRSVFVAGQAVAPSLLEIPRERLLDAPAIMGSPQIGPPAPSVPARVVAAPPAVGQSSATRFADHIFESTAWARLVHAAATRSRNYQRAAQMHAVHLRIPAYATAPRSRHEIILQVAHASHIPTSGEARKKVITR